MQLQYGSHIGRVGALAVALGIGTAVAAPTGVAWAAPDDPTATSSPSDNDGSTPADPPAPGADELTTDDRDTDEPETDMPGTAESEGEELGASSPTTDPDAVAADDEDLPKPKKKKRAAAAHSARVVAGVAAKTPTVEQPQAQLRAVGVESRDVPAADVAASVTSTHLTVTQPQAVPAAKPVVVNPVQAVGRLISSVLRPVLSTVLGILPGGSSDSPLAWVLLAASRRQVGQPEPVAAGATAARTVAAAVTNAPPTATVTWGRPDATTGAVVGKLTAVDPEGKPVSLTVVPPTTPIQGTFAYDTKTTTITYTPTTAQRFAASATAGDDVVAITLRVSDQVNTVDVPVNIPVSPSPFYQSAEYTSVDGPSAVAATNNRVYITNRNTGTVTVYDTINNTVVRTIDVGGAPDGIAVKADGTRIYVSSSTTDKVTVIDTATGLRKAELVVANPTAIAINPSGSVVYVANGSGAMVTKINTSTNKTAGTVKLTAGMTATELAVSADGKRIYVAGAKESGGGQISWFASTATKAIDLTPTDAAPTGLAYNSPLQAVYAVDADGKLTIYNVVKKETGVLSTGHPLSGVAVTRDGSAVMVTTSTGLVAALSTVNGATLGVTGLGVATAEAGVALSSDGTRMFVTDSGSGVVHAISLVPPNNAPFSNDPAYSVTNPATGALAGTVGVVDFDGDPLTYQVIAKPTKGTLVLNPNGTYTYTPTAAARHAASRPGAPAATTTDSFTVDVSDGRNGVVRQTITLTIDPANKIPTVTTTIGGPHATTGAVKVTIKTSDGDKDKTTIVVTQPGKGAVTATGAGVYTYTPDAAALAAARAPGASYEAKKDSFTITVDDGFGGVVPVTVNVRIGAANLKPVWVTQTVGDPAPRSGVVTGAVNATDVDGDALTYTANKTTKGTITFNPDGTFTYTPTAAARAAASKRGASAAAKSETVTVTVSDGFGGTVTKTVKVNIGLNPTTNNEPTGGAATVTATSTGIGAVTGVVTADDGDGDTLTYVLGSGPSHGTVKVGTDGRFTYIPDVDARYRALMTSAEDTDSFVVTISDGFGGSTSATVQVTIAPPSASAVDQRATTVAVNVQQLYFSSQAETDMALGLLKAAGVDTIRILLPWGRVETEDDTFDWTALDRVINSANANDIRILATINTTPVWAAVPGQPVYAGAPADLEAFGDFVSEVATRYQGKVADYEIWNEPNYNGFWAPTPDAAKYTALLKIAYTAIKAADPDATVIGGSVAAVAETPGGSAVNPVTYLSQMYAAGAAGYFDALAYHPYQYGKTFSAQEGHAGMPFTQAQQMYAVMVANGDGNKKIWASEYGQPSSEGGEANQAAFVGDFLRAWRDLEFAGPAFLHTIADYPHEAPSEATFGLFREDWTPKPVVAVVTQVIAENQAINAGAGISA